jgi:predicted transcriptional regulator
MSFEEHYTESQIKISRYAKALSHPVRVFIVEYLATRHNSCCYSGDMAELVPIARSTLSEHLKELKDAGLIQGEINAPKIKYCINADNWQEAKGLFKDFFKHKQSRKETVCT